MPELTKNPVIPVRQPFTKTKRRTKKQAKAGKLFRKLTIKWKSLSSDQKESVRRLFVWVCSILLAFSFLSGINDITALNRSPELRTVTITQNESLTEVLNSLHRAKLIHHPRFARGFLTLTGMVPRGRGGYYPGIYELSPDMGVEEMLKIISHKDA